MGEAINAITKRVSSIVTKTKNANSFSATPLSRIMDVAVASCTVVAKSCETRILRAKPCRNLQIDLPNQILFHSFSDILSLAPVCSFQLFAEFFILLCLFFTFFLIYVISFQTLFELYS